MKISHTFNQFGIVERNKIPSCPRDPEGTGENMDLVATALCTSEDRPLVGPTYRFVAQPVVRTNRNAVIQTIFFISNRFPLLHMSSPPIEGVVVSAPSLLHILPGPRLT
jgi:hypothetical protein